jgi:hypothetical protein
LITDGDICTINFLHGLRNPDSITHDDIII